MPIPKKTRTFDSLVQRTDRDNTSNYQRVPLTKKELQAQQAAEVMRNTPLTVMRTAERKDDSPDAIKRRAAAARRKELKKGFDNTVVPALDVATDVAQLGNFSPEPIGQLVGKIGNVVGGVVDAYQAVDDIVDGDYSSAAINAASAVLPNYLDSKSFRRNSKNLRPGDFLYPLKTNTRVKYLNVGRAVNKQTPTMLNVNRALLGGVGLESVYDASQIGGGDVEEYAAGGKVRKKRGFPKYGPGGQVPVEVEGGEMAETPQGEILKFTGPDHEDGGVPVALPENTEIYSKRIKINGESMADRKASRERKMNRLTNLFQKDPTNPLAQNTAKRTAHNIMLQEQMDRAIMEQASPVLKGRNPQLADEPEQPGEPLEEAAENSDPTQPQPLSDNQDQQMPQYGFGGAALSGVGSGPSTGSSFNGGGVGRRVGGMGGGVAAGAADTTGGFEFDSGAIAGLPWASLGTGLVDIATQLAHGKYDEVDSPLLAETEFLRPYAGGGKAKHWIQGAVNPDHKGYCTPMTKSTCTPRRKAFAQTMKKHHGFHAGGGEVQVPQEVLNSVGNPYLVPGTGSSMYNPSANTVNYNQFSPEDIPHELGHSLQNARGQLSNIAVPPANQSVVRSFDPDYYNTRGNEHGEMMGVIYDHLGEMGQFVPPELVANRANDALYRRDYTAEGDAELTLAPQIRKAIKSHSKYAGGSRVGYQVGDEVDISPSEIKRLKQLGYEFM